MYWGHGAYGVEAASRLYFASRPRTSRSRRRRCIAGIIQGTERQSPFVNMDAAVAAAQLRAAADGRRGLHHQAQADDAQAEADRRRAASRQQPPSIAPYFVEEVRKHLESSYGAKVLYESGLTVTTTLDPALQEAANRAVERGPAAARQAARLPHADAQRARREADGRRLQGRALEPADRGRRHRARRSSSPPAARPAGGTQLRIGRYQPTWRARASPGRAAHRRPICSRPAI